MKCVAQFEPAICVADLDGMKDFYCGKLGMTVFSEIVVPPEKSAPPGLAANGYTIVRLETNDGQRFKLVRPNDAPTGRVDRDFVLDHQGFAFVTFLIDDLPGLIAQLQASGIALMGDDQKFEVRDGVDIAFVKDPEGNCIELVEYADITTYRPELAAAD